MRKLILALLLLKGFVTFGQQNLPDPAYVKSFDSAYGEWLSDRAHHVYRLSFDTIPCSSVGLSDTIPVQLFIYSDTTRRLLSGVERGYTVAKMEKYESSDDPKKYNPCNLWAADGGFLDIFRHRFDKDLIVDLDPLEYNPETVKKRQ